MTNEEQKPKLLFADDNGEYRTSMVRALGRDYDVSQVCNADELITEAQKPGYFLIITDNNMGDGYGDSGLHAIRQIRAKGISTPIFLHSAGPRDLEERAMQAGATGFIEKPVNLRELKEMIAKCAP